jgi:hypothetical protein
MARIKIEAVVDHLDSEFKKALDDTMRQYAPNVRYHSSELFRFFVQRVYHHCNSWETVPDSYIEGA